jgi:methylisocitrate lyase
VPQIAAQIDNDVARAMLHLDAGAEAIFPEALTSAEMFRAFQSASRREAAGEHDRVWPVPFFTAQEFESMGYAMVIWFVSSLQTANKAQAALYRAIAHDGGARRMVEAMQNPGRASRFDRVQCVRDA